MRNIIPTPHNVKGAARIAERDGTSVVITDNSGSSLLIVSCNDSSNHAFSFTRAAKRLPDAESSV
jgi:hypothetical protein